MDFEAAAAAPPTTRAGTLLLALRALVVLLLVLLVALGLAWELRLAPTGSGMLALKVLPLAAALSGLLKHRLYTYRWLALLVWLYVLEGLWRAASGRGVIAALAAAEAGLALALFAVVSLYIRRRLRGAGAA